MPSSHYLYYLLVLFINVKGSITILILLILLFSLCCLVLVFVIVLSCSCSCSFRLCDHDVMLIFICVIRGIMSLGGVFLVIILVSITVDYLIEFYFPVPLPVQ